MDLIKQLTLNLRLIRLQRFLGSLYYSYARDWWERQAAGATVTETAVKPGKLLSAEPSDRGASLRYERAELEVCFLAPDLVRVEWQPGTPPVPYGIACEAWPEVEIGVERKSDTVVISSNTLVIVAGLDGALEWQTPAGKILRQDLPPQRQDQAWQHQGQLRPEECLYGLGERATPFNLRKRGQPYRMWHYDAGGVYSSGTDPLYLCIPVYLSLHQQGSYLIFYENSHSATFTFDNLATANFEGGALRYYFMVGEPASLQERYTELTGRPFLPPRWALGYHQSRWGYETEKEVRAVVQGFLSRNLPLSAIHLDIDCKDNFRSFTLDPDRFPKLAEFDRELAAKGVRLIAIVNPGVKCDRNNPLYREGITQEVFCLLPNGKPVLAPVWPGLCAFPDFTNPLARHWWSRQYEYLLDLGVTGFWHDMNEPGVFTLWGDATLPRPTCHHLEGRGGSHVEAHNVYGLLQARAGYEALREYKPQQRPFIVSRSGWAGLQRYAWTWTGDVETSWEGLRQTVPTILGMSLSGIPYTGPDIGGFKGNPSPELYLRWFQLSTFLPFFRTHSANNAKPRTPWSYGEPILKTVREFLQLRYRLIPYWYTLAWEANQKGYPPVRPLFWNYSQETNLWDVEDAFLVGDAFLVCPILGEGARQREAVLPQGHWYDFWEDTLVEGGKTITLDAPLERLPLLVKAGSVVPMEVEQQLWLHLYLPIEGTNTSYLYSDAGDGYGEWRIEQFTLQRFSDGVELIWEQQGDFPFPYAEVRVEVHGMKLQQAWIDEQEVAVEGQQLQCQPFRRAFFRN